MSNDLKKPMFEMPQGSNMPAPMMKGPNGEFIPMNQMGQMMAPVAPGYSPQQGYPGQIYPVGGQGNYQQGPQGPQVPLNRQATQINVTQQKDEYSNMKYEQSYPCYENCMQCYYNCLGTFRQFCVCLCVDNPNIEIPQSYCGLKLRFGKYVETVGPGLQFIVPGTEKIIKVDLQTQTLDLVKQSVITKDNITACIDTAVNFKITNPRYAIFRLDNLNDSVKNLCYSALRTVIGIYTLNEVQEKKAEITAQLQKYLNEHVKTWGISIEQIFITEIILNHDLQETLSSAAKMQRAAESKVISAKADIESAKMMREAADTLSSAAAMQIRYFETIQHLVHAPAQKVVFIPFIQDE